MGARFRSNGRRGCAYSVIGPFQPAWGGRQAPLWSDLLLLGASLVALALAVLRLVRARPRPEIGYWLLCAALSVALLIPIAALLFWLVDVRAVHLAIPYALLATSFVAPPLRR